MKNKKEEIAEKILAYLEKNPKGGDTLEGISGWWLESIKINKSVDEVSQAIECLVKKGLVVRSEVKGGRPIYKIGKKG